jgi:hypothetical protein
MLRAEEYFRNRSGVLNVPVRFGPIRFSFRKEIASGILVCRDFSDAVRAHDAIEMNLRTLSGLPFPDLHVVLTARPHFPPGTRLSVKVSYEAPLGIPGRIFDALVGRHVALSIAGSLLDDMCLALARSSPNLHKEVTPVR